LIKKALIFAILTYKNLVSPHFGNACRHYPVCSSYTIDAIEKYGVFIGLGKSVLRLLRCNRFFKGGYDPA
jgi:uncharacterized protein